MCKFRPLVFNKFQQKVDITQCIYFIIFVYYCYSTHIKISCYFFSILVVFIVNLPVTLICVGFHIVSVFVVCGVYLFFLYCCSFCCWCLVIVLLDGLLFSSLSLVKRKNNNKFFYLDVTIFAVVGCRVVFVVMVLVTLNAIK